MKEVTIGKMKINGIGAGCTVTFGPSVQVGNTTKRYKNQGFGEDNSDMNTFHNPRAILLDQDVSDSTNYD